MAPSKTKCYLFLRSGFPRHLLLELDVSQVDAVDVRWYPFAEDGVSAFKPDENHELHSVEVLQIFRKSGGVDIVTSRVHPDEGKWRLRLDGVDFSAQALYDQSTGRFILNQPDPTLLGFQVGFCYTER